MAINASTRMTNMAFMPVTLPLECGKISKPSWQKTEVSFRLKTPRGADLRPPIVLPKNPVRAGSATDGRRLELAFGTGIDSFYRYPDNVGDSLPSGFTAQVSEFCGLSSMAMALAFGTSSWSIPACFDNISLPNVVTR
jgi:hypothetical protein